MPGENSDKESSQYVGISSRDGLIAMMHIRPGSHTHSIIELLATVGEFPWRSLAILGDKRTIQTLIRKLETVQEVKWGTTGLVYSGKLLQINGKGLSRSIRFYKGALTILENLHPRALEYYLDAFDNHNFPSDLGHVGRNHRIAEVVAMCKMAGIAYTPYALPLLQKERVTRTLLDSSCFYTARGLKQIDKTELSKTIYTRIVGAIFSPGGCYAMYNTRNAVMKWSGGGEIKTRFLLGELARMNAGVPKVDSAILVGSSHRIALEILKAGEKSSRDSRNNLSFSRVYQHIHFLPMSPDGIRLLSILTTPDWNEILLDALFEPEMRPKAPGSIEHDAYSGGRYYLSHLDGDIARLTRLRSALGVNPVPIEVICYPWQAQFLRNYLGESVLLKQLDTSTVLSVLGEQE